MKTGSGYSKKSEWTNTN